ncbi:putative Cyclic di-GMP-binding protein [Beijerinckiaceae bacterium RH AL1]|nr:cellulose biosynthesis cyclic di-GMP-binding regulatory protein BcsB [Beijerinckiaceae bacterium]VVB42720.1 putative Cyclic di-GMP-binding protein [Beijerinckiaceae bacterium RH AL8]VVB42727.1 putative Cyclic di-GMP-binding protein [Beijerinckiaceae bacterium RH CH11]VVC53468.1 putative Cyclic di-GMP-binding protein [Beijerinckiaceae bacterium RH AL1]
MPFSQQLDLSTLGAAARATVLMVGLGGAVNALGLGASPAIAMPADAPHQDLLRHMPSTGHGPRLEGTADELHWSVFLTADQAAHATRFRLTYASAISVLPDASTLELDINGHTIGEEKIDASNGEAAIEMAIPAGTLKHGVNAVSVAAHHRHRVDCSMAATYELWTQIDAAASGLVLAAEDRGVTSVADLPALLPGADGRLPIHVLLAGKMELARLRRIMAATQTIAIAADALQPIIDFEQAADGTEGLDLALGTRDELRRLPQGSRISPDTVSLAIVPASPAGHPLLVVTGATDDAVEAALSGLAAAINENGLSQQQLPASEDPRHPRAGATSFTLADMGRPTRSSVGSLFHQAIDLALPADALLSDYGRATLDLAADYAGGLERAAQVRIDVNGRSAGIVRMARQSGGALSHDQLFLPLGQMHPGHNRIDLHAELPRQGDDTCAASAEGRFTLHDTTRLSLPTLARGLRLPDVGLATAGAVPYDRGTPHLVVPSPDRSTMAAALSLAARFAVAAGRPIPFAFSQQMPQSDDGSTLVVAAAQKLDPQLMRAIGLDPSAVETAWRDAAASKGVGAPRWWLRHSHAIPACQGGGLDAATPRLGSHADGPAEPTPILAHSSLIDWAITGTRGVRDWLDARVRLGRLPMWAHDAPTAVSASASLVLAQGMSPSSRRSVTTIVTAPTASGLLGSMACLFDPRVWPEARGRLAIIGGDGHVETTEATSFTYVASGLPSLGNTRLVVAQWFSLNPLAFAATALVMAVLLSGSTLWLVRNVGRRTP